MSILKTKVNLKDTQGGSIKDNIISNWINEETVSTIQIIREVEENAYMQFTVYWQIEQNKSLYSSTHSSDIPNTIITN